MFKRGLSGTKANTGDRAAKKRKTPRGPRRPPRRKTTERGPMTGATLRIPASDAPAPPAAARDSGATGPPPHRIGTPSLPLPQDTQKAHLFRAACRRFPSSWQALARQALSACIRRSCPPGAGRDLPQEQQQEFRDPHARPRIQGEKDKKTHLLRAAKKCKRGRVFHRQAANACIGCPSRVSPGAAHALFPRGRAHCPEKAGQPGNGKELVRVLQGPESNADKHSRKTPDIAVLKKQTKKTVCLTSAARRGSSKRPQPQEIEKKNKKKQLLFDQTCTAYKTKQPGQAKRRAVRDSLQGDATCLHNTITVLTGDSPLGDATRVKTR
ncbi:hypothetical protein NDU88_003301 [Pleurodeles waltl]|uniref:Uncharacterized protein n=1 Tax=Pleurodeles waltl TaxID=8319 RepID=A0AAV7M5T3_PLEWA|nr:hypothetical protein NDU88_003301 [Pleurodeles waltl]